MTIIEGEKLNHDCDLPPIMEDQMHNKSYSSEEIELEYSKSANADEEYSMVKWGSNDSMMNRFHLVRRKLDISEFTDWLDIGCGTGAFQRELYTKTEDPPEGLAIDISEALIDYAQNNFQHPKCEFVCQDFLEVKTGDFDLLTAIGVLQKTNVSLIEFFEKSAQLMRERGTLFVDTKHLGWKKFEKPDFSPEPSHQWFETDDIINPAQNAGFNVLELSGFIPRENRVVDPADSHTMFMIAKL